MVFVGLIYYREKPYVHTKTQHHNLCKYSSSISDHTGSLAEPSDLLGSALQLQESVGISFLFSHPSAFSSDFTGSGRSANYLLHWLPDNSSLLPGSQKALYSIPQSQESLLTFSNWFSPRLCLSASLLTFYFIVPWCWPTLLISQTRSTCFDTWDMQHGTCFIYRSQPLQEPAILCHSLLPPWSRPE